MKRAVMTLTLLSALWSVPTRADDTLGERVDRATEAVGDGARGVKERAGDVAERATEQVSERMEEVAEAAREKTREAASSLGESAEELADSAKTLWARALDGARDKARRLGESAGGALERGKDAALRALSVVREEARAILLGAAEALDTKTREARKAARRARWEHLRERFSLSAERPSEALSEELRDHEYRIARLKRARTLAQSADDHPSLDQSDRLLETEYGRHRRRMEEIRSEERRERQR